MRGEAINRASCHDRYLPPRHACTLVTSLGGLANDLKNERQIEKIGAQQVE